MFLNKPVLRVRNKLFMLHQKQGMYYWMSLIKGQPDIGSKFISRELAMNFARERVRMNKSVCQLIEIKERH